MFDFVHPRWLFGSLSHWTGHVFNTHHPKQANRSQRSQKLPNRFSSQRFLGGGFNFLLFSPLFGEDSRLTNIFQMGWFNHQLGFLLGRVFTTHLLAFVTFVLSARSFRGVWVICQQTQSVTWFFKPGQFEVRKTRLFWGVLPLKRYSESWKGKWDLLKFPGKNFDWWNLVCLAR